MTATAMPPATAVEPRPTEASPPRVDAPNGELPRAIDFAAIFDFAFAGVAARLAAHPGAGGWSLFAPEGFAAAVAPESATPALVAGIHESPVSVVGNAPVAAGVVPAATAWSSAGLAEHAVEWSAPTPSDTATSSVARDAYGDAAVRTPQTDITLRVDPQNPAEAAARLERVARIAIRNGRSSMRVQLDPPSLGIVEVDVEVTHKKLNVHFTVENDEVRSALLKQLPELREALAGYTGNEEVTVDLRSSGDPENGAERGELAPGVDGASEEGSPTAADLAGTSRVGQVIDLQG